MSPPLTGVPHLTGLYRFRRQSRVFGDDVLVLQVQAEMHNLGPYPKELTCHVWRDAQIQDLTTVFPGGYLVISG